MNNNFTAITPLQATVVETIEKLIAEGKTTEEIVAQVTEALSGSTGKPKYSCICAMPANEAETAIRKRYSTPANSAQHFLSIILLRICVLSLLILCPVTFAVMTKR